MEMGSRPISLRADGAVGERHPVSRRRDTRADQPQLRYLQHQRPHSIGCAPSGDAEIAANAPRDRPASMPAENPGPSRWFRDQAIGLDKDLMGAGEDEEVDSAVTMRFI